MVDRDRLFGVFPFAGNLHGAGGTRVPSTPGRSGRCIRARGPYLLAVPLAWGLLGVSAGTTASYLRWALIAVAGFVRGDRAGRAAGMMSERDELPTH